MSPEVYGRGRPPRLTAVFNSYREPLYFVTFCAARRKNVLANDDLHKAFLHFAERGAQGDIAVGRYVIMPDHIHVFVSGHVSFRLDQWVRLLKQILGKALTERGFMPPFWQRGFFDHVIRNSESYEQKWQYVRENPVRAGLVQRGEDWPYQGEVVLIEHR